MNVVRLKNFTNADGDYIQYKYDANNNLIRITYPPDTAHPSGKQVNYTYNSRNMLETVTDWAGRVTSYQYDRIGRLITTTRPNSTTCTVAYDDASQLQSMREVSNGKLFPICASITMAAGQIKTRLLAPLVQSNFQHPTFTATHDDDNRLLTVNGASVVHDADGNMTSATLPSSLTSSSLTPWVLTYNSRNQLTNTPGVSYIYDAEGTRRSMTDATGTTRYTVDKNASLSRLFIKHNPDGTKTYYVYGIGLLYEVNQSEQTKTYHFDQVGSTIVRTDHAGQVIGRAAYSPYGLIMHKEGDLDTPFLYNGKFGVLTDSNGLIHMRARYYSPYLKRFLNADPIGFSGGSNWFAYADGNPISNNDPFGLCACGTSYRNSGVLGAGQSASYSRTGILLNDPFPPLMLGSNMRGGLTGTNYNIAENTATFNYFGGLIKPSDQRCNF
ncbi:MAG: hypothetical protein HC767_04595 [Akkermansiaceae bacterium]|nr:hypothetical protein [Akkermansiaceae bacterium]